MAINTDHGCSWTMDLDMVLGGSMDSDVIMTLAGSAGHSDWRGSSNSVAFKPTWPQVVTQILGTCNVFDGNRNLGHQHRP